MTSPSVRTGGLGAEGEGFLNDTTGGLGGQAVERILGDRGDAAELAERPVVQKICPVGTELQGHLAVGHEGLDGLRELPAVHAVAFLRLAEVRKGLERVKTLVRAAAEQLLAGPSQVRAGHDITS